MCIFKRSSSCCLSSQSTCGLNSAHITFFFEPLKTLYESVQWSIEKWNFRFHLGFLHVSILDFCCPLSFLHILWSLQSYCKDYSSLKLAWIRFWFPRIKIFQPCTLSGEIFRNIELLLFLILDSFSFPVLFILFHASVFLFKRVKSIFGMWRKTYA